MKLIKTDHINNSGIYEVRINALGRPISIIIDDFFPAKYDDQFPAFSKGHGPELWVLLLEKAWAKLHGSYRKIEAGSPSSTLRDLTGAPSYHYNLKDTPNIWDIFYENDAKNYVFALATDCKNNGKSKMQGLFPSHAYALIRVVFVKDK